MKPRIDIRSSSAAFTEDDLERLAIACAGAFGCVAVASKVRFDTGFAFDHARGQHNSTLLLAGLLERFPGDGVRRVLITDADLYIPVLTFVFGEAQLGGTAAVVSTHRLANQHYGLPADAALLTERTAKEVIHELGHTFGLLHCRQFECVMRSSTYVGEVDMKRQDLCPECRRALAALELSPAVRGAPG